MINIAFRCTSFYSGNDPILGFSIVLSPLIQPSIYRTKKLQTMKTTESRKNPLAAKSSSMSYLARIHWQPSLL